MDSFDFKRMRLELAEVYPEWANIPADVLRYIASKTHSILDFIRIAAVCRSWQACLKDDRKPEFPICLMIEDWDGVNRRFYTASYDHFINLSLPEIKGRKCWGTPLGWLITYGDIDFKTQLFNPLSRRSFQLPSLRNLDHTPWRSRDFFSGKFLLSSAPTSPDCIVMAIYSREKLLAFTKPCFPSWTRIDTSSPLRDVNCFNGSFFAVANSGQLLICQDLNGPSSPKAVGFAEPPPGSAYKNKHIVDLGDHLCMIVRTITVTYSFVGYDGIDFEERYDENETWEVEIFKLDMVTREWQRIWSLGDWSLFLGNCSGFSVVAADDHPGGCRPNCIYFADGEYEGVTAGRYLTGIYNCDNKEVDFLPESHYLLRYFFSRPLWIKPSSQ